MEDCVSDQQFMLCTLLQKEEAIAVALSFSFSPNYSFAGLVVCAHSSNEVSQEDDLFVCVEVLRPSQPNGVMSSAVSLPNHTFTGQA